VILDLALTVLFCVYVGLALSAPLFVVPATVICRKLGKPSWKGAIACIPWLGLPMFALIIGSSQESAGSTRPADRR
jgi:hypothetical protein